MHAPLGGTEERFFGPFADKGDLLLASCSQDCFVRVWRISSSTSIDHATNTATTSTIGGGATRVDEEIKLRQKLISINVNGKSMMRWLGLTASLKS